jgi:putative ABC transport system permease protein
MGVGLGPLQKWIIGDTRLPLLVFLAAVGFVLLIACANVANLMLARGAARAREIGLRMALGAGRNRLIRQLLTEGLLLSVLGGGLGVFLSVWLLPLLLRLSPGTIPRLDEVRLDGRAIGFTIALTLLTTLLFGVLPAIEGTRLDLVGSIKDAGRGTTPGRGRLMQNLLVVAEVALSLVLVTASGLLLRSFSKLAGVSPGFNPDRLLTFQLSLPNAKYPKGEQGVAFYNELEDRLRNLPGVASVGSTTTLPLKGFSYSSDFTIENRPPGEYGKEVRHNTVTPDYFRTVGIPLERGRFFTLADGPKATPAIIINHSLEQQYFAGEDPLGKRLKFSKPEVADNDWFTIAGVVGDEKQDGLGMAAKPEIYQPISQNPFSEIAVVVRTYGETKALVTGVREHIKAMDPELPPFNIQTMNDVLYGSLARERFTTVLLLIFGGVALALAAVGVYGIISYGVTQRVQEVGVRMALGAQGRDVLRLIVGQGLKLVLIGIFLGAAAAFAATRLISDLLNQVSATDPVTFGATSLLIVGVALLACYVPARRAASIDPIEAIRIE